MKLHLKRMFVFKLSSARVLSALAVVALTISAMPLSATPVRAHTGSSVALQCRVNPSGVAIACNGTIPGGSVGLNCQISAVTINNGVYSIVGGTCSITSSLGLVTVSETIQGAAITLDSNSGLIYVHDTDAATLMVSEGLASVTATTGGGPLFLNLSQPSLTVVTGNINVNASLLGIGVAQIAVQGSAASVNVSNSTLTISGPNFSASESVLGLLTFNAACGSSVAIHLNQIFPINLPLLSCSAV